jgi:hypothetical protein
VLLDAPAVLPVSLQSRPLPLMWRILLGDS